jgi:hypothetical protein
MPSGICIFDPHIRRQECISHRHCGTESAEFLILNRRAHWLDEEKRVIVMNELDGREWKPTLSDGFVVMQLV